MSAGRHGLHLEPPDDGRRAVVGVGEPGIVVVGLTACTTDPEPKTTVTTEPTTPTASTGPTGTVVEVPDWGTITIVEGEAGEAGDNGRAPLWIQTVTDFPVVDESPI